MLYFIWLVAITSIVCGHPDVKTDLQTDNGVIDIITKPKYELTYQASNWNEAREACSLKGGQLAVARSQKEFQRMQALVRSMRYADLENADYSLIAWVGVSNSGDLLTWTTVDGEAIEDSGYNTWAGNRDDTGNPKAPHCAGVDAINVGYRDWWCNKRLPYICQYNN